MGIRVKLLKRKFHNIYLDYMHAKSHLDCGGSLAEYISPCARRQKAKLSKVYKKLRKLDPSCPMIGWLEE